MKDGIASKAALIEVRLTVLDQVRDWLRRSLLAIFALYVLTSIMRELRFDDAHRLPLAIMLVLLGAGLLGVTLRVVLALARSRLARQLQALRLETLIHESRKQTTTS
ncbi:hypothetical protein [Arenimonas alkanexedens]